MPEGQAIAQATRSAMMALPFPYYDSFVDLGWLRELQPASLVYILGFGRIVNGKTLRARVTRRRLQPIIGLSRSSFFKAQKDVLERGLLKLVRDELGKRVYMLVSPPPSPHRLEIETPKSHPGDSKVSKLRPRIRQTARQSGRSAAIPTTDKDTVRETVQVFMRCLEGVEVGIGDGVSRRVMQAVRAVESDCDLLTRQAHDLSRYMQASGIPVGHVQVQAALERAVAALQPITKSHERETPSREVPAEREREQVLAAPDVDKEGAHFDRMVALAQDLFDGEVVYVGPLLPRPGQGGWTDERRKR